MTRANGYTVVPEDREGLEEGELVTVQMFEQING
jgi:molybdopterin biosynthesis enzyme